MNRVNLTAETQLALEARPKKVRDIREGDRIKAVLLSSEGWSTSMIAQALRKHETCIRRHLKDYINNEKLQCANGGSSEKLSKAQTAALIAHLSAHQYQHNHQIVAYIKTRWGIDYTVSGLHKWLHRHGIVNKQPKGVPAKADAAQQQAFIEQYTELKSRVGPDEPILFSEGVHPTQATKLTYGWIKKGANKAMNTTASRTRVNLVGAIELGALSKAITATYDSINAEAIVDFMSQLRAHYRDATTIHWVVDGAGYHKAQIVQDKANEGSIQIHILPPYSPNLNPIERLWKVMNEHVRNNHYFHSAKEFRESIEHFFKKTLPEIADTLDTRINDNFQIIYPAG